MISSRKENYKVCEGEGGLCHVTSFTVFFWFFLGGGVGCGGGREGGAKNDEMGFGINSMQVFFMGFGMLPFKSG